ncbi:hypothetical protein CHARACLAT_025026 [Characodon lateralis]|uniref:Uncharacterized protein n=1 Tax=Characodon lateralis TaxID=208331 RepID=A0ABU7DMK3_9TELE|nr:hypothetical protein [Characodon lateralis]
MFGLFNDLQNKLLIWQLSCRQSLAPSTRCLNSLLIQQRPFVALKVEWKERLAEKSTRSRRICSFGRIVKQSQFKSLGEIHMVWNGTGVGASRVIPNRCFQDMSYNATFLLTPVLN